MSIIINFINQIIYGKTKPKLYLWNGSPFFQEYEAGDDVIIYTVDATNHRLFKHYREEIQNILQNSKYFKKPIIIMAINVKQKFAVPEKTLTTELGLEHARRNVKIFMSLIECTNFLELYPQMY
jgi:GTPase SAR1 family protein